MEENENEWKNKVIPSLAHLVGIHRGRGHNQLHVAATRHDLFEQAQKNVCMQRPLVCFVHDDGAVLVQIALLPIQEFSQQYSVRHVLDDRVFRRAVLKADRVADDIT